MSAPQTSFSEFPAEAFEGLVVNGLVQDGYIASYVCDGDVIPGRDLELTTAGKVRMPQGTGAGLPLAGMSVLKTTSPSSQPIAASNNYKDGDVVPVLRRGRIWCAFTGGSPNPGDSLNVNHSSTTATDRGKLTASGTDTTSGSEIAAAFVQLVKLSASGTMALVDVNYPAIAGAVGATGPTGSTGPTGP